MRTFVPLLDVDRIVAMLGQISVFGGLGDKHLYQVFRLLGKAVFEADEAIFSAGEPSEAIYIIESGAMEIVIPDAEVRIDKVHLGPGDCFGEASFVGIHRHTATATCLERSEIIALDRKAFLTLQKTDLELFALLALNLARELARRLQLTDQILIHYLHRH
jgi:CRP-like cAMP-binding protein